MGRLGPSLERLTALRFFVITISGIFLAEVVAMIVIYRLDKLPYYLQTLIDAALMELMIFPLIYFLSLRPLTQEIEKQKRTQRALEQSEERFRRVFHSNPIASSITRATDGNFLDVNERFLQLFGYQRDEVIGHTALELSLYLYPEERAELTRRLREEGSVDNFEAVGRTRTGEIRNITLYTVAIEAGNETWFLGTMMDVTEKKRAEEKLRWAYDELELRVQERTAELRQVNQELDAEVQVRRQAETELLRNKDRLKRAQEIAHLGSWELDLEKDELTWSDEVYRIFGMQPQEFGASYEAFIGAVHPDDRTAVDEAYNSSIRDGKNSYEIEHRVTRQSTGEVRIVHEKCEHFRDAAGSIVRSIGMVHDITERKQADIALRAAHDELERRVQDRTRELSHANAELIKEVNERKQAESQLHIQTTAMEAAANGIVITDCNGTIKWANPAVAQITGYERPEMLGQNMRLFRSGTQDLDYYHRMWATILSGEVWRGELVNRRKDGTIYFEEQTITPIRSEDGRSLDFVAIKQDITERKLAQQELERRNMELQNLTRLERAQRQFSEALVEAALALNKSMQLDQVLPLMLEQIQEVIPYRLANIMLLEGDSVYEASHRGNLGQPEENTGINPRFALDDLPLLRTMQANGKPILLEDARGHPHWPRLDVLDWVRSALSAPLLVDQKVIGFVNLFSEQPGFFTPEMRDRLIAFAAHATVAIQNAWLFEQARASNERLQFLSRRLVEVQESERLYISRELHDEAGQVLTSLLIDLQLLENNLARPEATAKILKGMEKSLHMVMEELHRIAMALRPASLDHVGLEAAIQQQVETIGEKNGLRVRLKTPHMEQRLAPNVETVLYRIVQEALTNIVKHAQATQVDVVLTERAQKLVLIIEDNGIGFDPEAILGGEHLGLFGMRERAEMIGGTLTIESTPGKGTLIMVEVAYANTLAGGG
jgi:PAS domain S-box-containing protein